MEYRNSTLPEVNLSPAEIVFGRRVRTSIPTEESKFKNQHAETVKTKLAAAQQRMKQHYDKSSKERTDFKKGEIVRL